LLFISLDWVRELLNTPSLIMGVWQ